MDLLPFFSLLIMLSSFSPPILVVLLVLALVLALCVFQMYLFILVRPTMMNFVSNHDINKFTNSKFITMIGLSGSTTIHTVDFLGF